MIPLPPEFMEMIEKMLGDEAPAFFASLEERAALALRVNPAKKAAPRAAARYAEAGVPWEKYGYYLKEGVKPGASIAHAAGAFYLQEASAMLSVAILKPRPDESILDLCAAPGGKSTQIAGYMENTGLLISNEPEPSRCRVLASNLERMGALNAVAVNAYPNVIASKWQETFDAIVCDAPCSGEGMFRRDPNARLEWRCGSPSGCAGRQAEILDQAAGMLRKGGRLVYSTCTFNPQENEDTIASFLDRHPDFRAENFEIEGVGSSVNGCMRIFPHKQRGDGHFAARLIRDGEARKPVCAPPRVDKEAQKYLRMLEDGVCALPECLKDRRFERVGEYLYAVPQGCPDMSGVRRALPGACVLRIGKNYVEPAHALAMGMEVENAHRSIGLTQEQAVKYLAGETIEADAEKGWTLITHEGLALGWGKVSGGQIKNHLPKGLRLSLHL